MSAASAARNENRLSAEDRSAIRHRIGAPFNAEPWPEGPDS